MPHLSSHCYNHWDHTVATITLDTTVASDTFLAFAIPLVSLLMLSPVNGVKNVFGISVNSSLVYTRVMQSNLYIQGVSRDSIPT
jgi:hypothetical protein